ncbi:hypothetical protein ASPWEDRAFT_25326 [Aspergillus wentii DTO 134E9]|uniref:Fungal N-terminal domain-containing protein n=1 Tax=Aspergillus wentii DTO 134E9 TaxID=1073089 RepID=A0A1L9RX45_ASPWE|nr:uncharacterized protein ASPWEDRAFT_25326 [Aspergillus wentii DTO 134E9]OJJ39499.1 hypothetical protein ASPWEDRAFT_25326 [Aspergillus wentii DTO 134E9]
MGQSGAGKILRTAGAGVRLSLLLNAAACQISQSGIEIHCIARGISLFSLVLKQMGQTIRLADLDHSCIAVAKARKIADQGQGVFDEIEHMLDMLKSTDSHESLRTIPLSHRVKWSFRKHHITYLLAHLEYLKLSLIVLQKIVHIEMLIKTMSSFDLEKDETIAQEKAETQNMIIVRYWSGNRLSRLWEFAEQEAFEAANDQTNQLITSHYSTLRTSPSDSHGAKLTKYPDFSLNDTNMDLSAMEISSKDMVQLSEKTVEVLLSTLFPTSGHSTSRSVQNQGYPLESTTIDWRKPRSQEARQHAAQLWERHSKYQAHVESDPEESTYSRRDSHNKDGNSESGTCNEIHRSQRESAGGSRNPVYIGSSRNTEGRQMDNHATPLQSTSLPTPSHFPPAPHHPWRGYTAHSRHDRDKSYAKPTKRATPRAAVHFVEPDHSPPSSTPHRPRGGTKDHHHRSFARSATKGLLGVGAIAGFMEALEAFSVI